MQKTRDLMKNVPPEIHTGVELVSSIGGNQSNADVQYFIQGPDLGKLSQYSDRLLAKMKKMPGLIDIDSTLRTRQARSAAGDRPPARRRPGRFGDGYRIGAQHAHRRPAGLHV